MKYDTVHTWKASAREELSLAVIMKAKVGKNESDRVRLGLRILETVSGQCKTCTKRRTKFVCPGHPDDGKIFVCGLRVEGAINCVYQETEMK